MKKDDDEAGKGVEKELQEEAAIKETDAVVYPGTVVVHVQYAEPKRRTGKTCGRYNDKPILIVPSVVQRNQGRKIKEKAVSACFLLKEGI